MNCDEQPIEFTLLKLMHKVDWIVYTLETLFKVEHQYEEADWSNDNEYGNPEWNAALDELERWLIEYSRMSLGHMPDQDTLHSKIASFCKGPADTVDILDEAFIRKQERERVCGMIGEFLYSVECGSWALAKNKTSGEIQSISIIREKVFKFINTIILDTLKGGGE